MLKHLLTYVVLSAFGSTSVNAQQHEAVLQKMQVPGTDFEIVLAVPKYPAAAVPDLGNSPDALLLHLVGGALVLGFEAPEKMIAALEFGAFSGLRLSCGRQGRQATDTCRCLRRSKGGIGRSPLSQLATISQLWRAPRTRMDRLRSPEWVLVVRKRSGRRIDVS